MAGYLVSDTRKVTTHRLMEMKERGEKISMLTSYDYTTARHASWTKPGWMRYWLATRHRT